MGGEVLPLAENEADGVLGMHALHCTALPPPQSQHAMLR